MSETGHQVGRLSVIAVANRFVALVEESLPQLNSSESEGMSAPPVNVLMIGEAALCGELEYVVARFHDSELERRPGACYIADTSYIAGGAHHDELPSAVGPCELHCGKLVVLSRDAVGQLGMSEEAITPHG